MGLFITHLFTDTKAFFLITIVVVFSICLHEFFHAWTALKLGDSTAADRGHLTLDPRKQMGTMSIIMFLILGFAWGAVPVNPYVLRARNRHAVAIVSLAGPATNFGLFLVGFFFFGFLGTRISFFAENEIVGRTIVEFFLYLGVYNAFLCVFNLLPIPGLDGWGALTEYQPQLRRRLSDFAERTWRTLIRQAPQLRRFSPDGRVPTWDRNSEFAKGLTIFLIILLIFSTRYLFAAAEWIMWLAPDLFKAG